MPNYEYTCAGDCSGTFEKIVVIEERNNQVCPKCGARADRVMSFSGIVWSPTKNGGHS
jgi:putative FmdB family regulatory protein